MLEQEATALLGLQVEQPGQHRIAGVERHADRHGLAVAQMIPRQRFQPMRRPMAEVERARAAGLERVAALRDLTHVQFARSGGSCRPWRRGSKVTSASAFRSSQRKNSASRISATFTASAMPAIFSRAGSAVDESRGR